MCLAVPGKILAIEGDRATVDFGGAEREASLALVTGASVGCYVLVHAGFAIEVVPEEDALETIALMNELAEALEAADAAEARA